MGESKSMAEPLYCVLHVPKCAGSTIESHLNKHLGSKAFWRPAKRTRNFPLELFGRKYDNRLPAAANGIKAVSGHFIGASIERHFAGRPIKRTLLLRRPGDHLLSWYNFRMMRYIAAGQAPYSLSLHLRSMPADPMAHFLLERWLELPLWRTAAMNPRQKITLLDHALSAFDFIGDIHDCDRLVALISSELGIEEKAERANTQENWMSRVDWAPLKYEDLTEASREMISRMTSLDDYLWRRWALKETVSFETRDMGTRFLAHEWRRPYFELMRRYKRNSGAFNRSEWGADRQ
jgi:hypothetical protein